MEEAKFVFNYRLSRARRVIENTFGILVARWRIFRGFIRASPKNVERYVLAGLCLHNYLRQTDKLVTGRLVSLTVRTRVVGSNLGSGDQLYVVMRLHPSKDPITPDAPIVHPIYEKP